MDNDVRELVESEEFRKHHKERQAPRFNVFDVLRYAEYENTPQQRAVMAAHPGRNSWTWRQVPAGIHGQPGSEAGYTPVGLGCGSSS